MVQLQIKSIGPLFQFHQNKREIQYTARLMRFSPLLGLSHNESYLFAPFS